MEQKLRVSVWDWNISTISPTHTSGTFIELFLWKWQRQYVGCKPEFPLFISCGKQSKALPITWFDIFQLDVWLEWWLGCGYTRKSCPYRWWWRQRQWIPVWYEYWWRCWFCNSQKQDDEHLIPPSTGQWFWSGCI